MRQRHVVARLYLFVAFWIATVIASYFVLEHLRRERQKPPFVEPLAYCVDPRQMLPDGMAVFAHCRHVPRQQDI